MKRLLITLCAIATFLAYRALAPTPLPPLALAKIPPENTCQIRPLRTAEAKEVETALSQPYRYFGCGGQCFVFMSDDGRYALKFFKQKRYQVPAYLCLLPSLFKYKQKKSRGLQERWERDCHSYKIAFESLQQETATLFVHLDQAEPLLKKITLIDSSGTIHALALDDYPFLLQRCAERVEERVSRLLKEGDVLKMKQSIRSLLDLILTRCKKGYHDTDPNLLTNCGFLEDRAVKIDIGHFISMEAMREKPLYHKALLQSALPFREWLKNQSSTLEPCFDAALFELLSEEENL